MPRSGGRFASVCAAVCSLVLAAGCGSSSSSTSTTSTTAGTSATTTAATTTTSKSVPNPPPKKFTCAEIKASPSKAHTEAALVRSEILRVTGGTVLASSEFANRQVRAFCAHAAPSDKAFLGAVRLVGVSAPVVEALARGQ